MRQVIYLLAGIVLAVTAIFGILTWYQIRAERETLIQSLQFRTLVMSEGLVDTLGSNFLQQPQVTLNKAHERFDKHEPFVGVALYDASDIRIASSTELTPSLLGIADAAVRDLAPGIEQGHFEDTDGRTLYVYVKPLSADGIVVSSLATIVDAEYIDASAMRIIQGSMVSLIAQILVISILIALLIRLSILQPIRELSEAIKRARAGTGGRIQGSSFFAPLANEISKLSSSLSQARASASEEARLRLEKIDTPWTAERLKEFIKAYLKGRSIFLLSNREPYIHHKGKNGPTWTVPASGMVTALEPVMEACGGLWIAQASGSADKETADPQGKLGVPPDEPRYTLKRVWLEEKDIQGFYTGFSNEALWPLCHIAHTRPIFRKEDWAAYKRVNDLFAKNLLSEIRNVRNPIILVQDFHFALVPQIIKSARPDAQIGIFWHIPWPSAESFSICPWRKEILEGMLGADIMGFHTQQYCNNFMDTVGKEIESLIDLERFTITREGHQSYIKPFPISIALTNTPLHETRNGKEILAGLNISTEFLGLGVDRLDYTKGIIERLKGVEMFLESHPEYAKRFTFLQIAPPSREDVTKYREYNEQVTAETARINEKFARDGWSPIVLEKKHYSHEQLYALYAEANFCLVTSLHDGMNLVAKEFVAARDDEMGALILSQFTGASRDMKGAIVVNPYSAEDTSEAIQSALTMPKHEQLRRMRTMRNAVRDYNVYRWSAEFLKAVANVN